jgi:hypothetical protein
MQGHWEIVVELCGKYGAACSVKDRHGKNVADVATGGETLAAARMCIEGEAAYTENVLRVGEETEKKLGAMQRRLDSAMAGLEEAQAVVARVEMEEDQNVPVNVTFSRLMQMLTSEASLGEASARNLTSLKKGLATALGGLDKEIERRLQESTALTLCSICKERPRDCVLMPCRHMACCGECAQNPRFRSCPLCLSRVENVAADVNLRGPTASAVALESQGSMRDMGEGNFSQRDVEEDVNVPFAPVVILRMSGDITRGFERDSSSRSMMADVEGARAGEVGGEGEDGVITAQVEVVAAGQ